MATYIRIPPPTNEDNANKDNMPAKTMPNQQVYKRVGRYIAQLLRAEVEHGDNPVFRVPKNQHISLINEVKTQFQAYGLHEWPFNQPVRDGQSVQAWWEELANMPNATRLAVRSETETELCLVLKSCRQLPSRFTLSCPTLWRMSAPFPSLLGQTRLYEVHNFSALFPIKR